MVNHGRMHRIDIAERRRRLAVRHALAPAHKARGEETGPAEIARRLVALHSTDPATVYLSVRARMASPVPAGAVEGALYGRRELVRMLAMRRTVFVFPAELVPVVQVSTADRIAREQRSRLLKLLTDATTVPDPEPWLADVERSVLGHLAAFGGTATAAPPSAAEPRLETKIVLAAGKSYQASPTITSPVLPVLAPQGLAARGQGVRGGRIGSGLSQHARWFLADPWLPDNAGPVGEAAARAELARQWLAAFGPAPLADLKWWTGWTMTQVKQAIAGVDAV